MARIDSLGDCPLCFGRLMPLSVCESCNSVVAREGLDEVGPELACEDCGATNPTHFVCTACNTRFPFEDIEEANPQGRASEARPQRRIRGEYEPDKLDEIARIPGVGRQRAEALCRAGYNALWKVSRALDEELARVPGIGPRTAAMIKDSLRFVLLVGRPRGRDEALSEEYACPTCGTATSVFSTQCRDCGAEFDEEEVDEQFRQQVTRQGDEGLLAYYDVRLLDRPNDPTLHYARGALLLAMNRPSDALASLEKALEIQPEFGRAAQARERAMDAARDVGIGPQASPETQGAPTGVETAFAGECPHCGHEYPLGATECPACGRRPLQEERASGPGPSRREKRLLDELGHAIKGERAPPPPPPPPLRGEVPERVIAEKREMLSFLSKVPGVSKTAAKATAGFFQNLEQVRMAEAQDLARIPGVAPEEARQIKAASDRILGVPEEVRPAAAPREAAVAPAPHRPEPARVGARSRRKPRASVAQRIPVAERRGLMDGRVNGQGRVNGRGRVNGQGRVNGRGRVNGQGRVNGLIFGRGRVNGQGRVNGLINGTGFINGGALTEPRAPRKRLLHRYVAIGAALLMIFAIAAALIPPPAATLAITIDGSFEDWQGVPGYVDGTASANLDVRISSVSLKVADSSLFLRAQVTGRAFGDAAGYDTLYAFLDVDGDAGTGYDLHDVGADFLVRISGWNGVVEDARLMQFDGAGRDDWTGWKTVGRVAAAASGSQVEVGTSTDDLEAFDGQTLRVRFAFDDNDGETSHTVVPLRPVLGALKVTQRSLVTLLTAGSQPFLEVRFEAIGTGARVVVQNVALATTAGAAFGAIPTNFEVVQGTPVVHIVTADPQSLAAGTAVFADVDAVLADRPHVVLGVEARAYVGAPPVEKRIDGLFADWPNPISDTDTSPIRRRPLDVVSRDGATIGDDIFLYARLAGSALEGLEVPDRLARSPPGGPPSQSVPAPPPMPRIGEDSARFYVDTDATVGGGFYLDGFEADRFVEVRGRGGRVTNASVYRWSGSAWAWEGVARTGVGASELEVGATFPAVGFNGTRLVAVTADWTGVADVADVEATRTRSDPGVIPLDGDNARIVTAKGLASEPTVDGNCGTSSSEYTGATKASTSDLKFFIGSRDAISFVFVCVEVNADATDNTLDWGELLFDQEHEDSSTPQDNDRRFRVNSGSTSLSSSKGDGSTWVSCGASCHSGNLAEGKFNNSVETYEFKIRYSDIWGSDSPNINENAGFALQAHNEDASTDYTWGSDTVAEANPGTWGRLEYPEFTDVVFVAVGVVVLVGWLRRRRRS